METPSIRNYLMKSLTLPNFWMSDEYIKKAGLVWRKSSNMEGWTNPEEDEWFFPPMGYNGPIYNGPFFCGPLHKETESLTVLDRQYIYDPKSFSNLSGSHWKVFRKNCQKFPKRNQNRNFRYKHVGPDRLEEEKLRQETERLVLKWVDGKEIQDPETFVKFCLFGRHRKGLFVNRELVGLNVWDENDFFINYRCCVDNGSSFLQEYLRWRFYIDPDITDKNKLVNDGGDLDHPGLASFKKRLNPIMITNVYTNERKHSK